MRSSSGAWGVLYSWCTVMFILLDRVCRCDGICEILIGVSCWVKDLGRCEHDEVFVMENEVCLGMVSSYLSLVLLRC